MENIGIQFEKALSHYEKKEYAEAGKLLDELLISNPKFHRGLFLKGVILDETGKTEEAKKYLEQAGSLFTLWFRLALQLQDIDPQRAITYFDKAGAMDPKNNMIWFNKGMLFEKMGRTDDAMACYRRLEPLREFLSRILIPSGFMIFLVSGAIMMLRRGEKSLATIVIASAVFCLFWLKRDGGKALQMLAKKKASNQTTTSI